ncbi:MAG TPA: hypothetical protein PK113_04875, partial [Bacillota bacterium]|nr:hypothetical protein [Bacillota bacterium]
AFVEGVDLNTITLDGDVVNTLFTELGQSDLITLSAYVALEPILEIAGTTVQAVITVPDNFSLDDWEGEFRAIGALAGEVLNTGLTIGDVESGDVMALLSVLSDVDFTILLDSQIVTQALINILSGAIPDLNLSQYIVIPDDIVWLDTDDGMGGTIYGELHNILTALNTIIDSVPDFNLENLDLSVIADLNPDDIVTIFNSRVLVATITDYVKNQLNFGDSFNLVLPDSVFDGVDGGGYLLQEELEAIVRAAHTIFSELACEATDDACGEMGFDMNGILTLGGDDIDTLLESEILAATIGSMVLDLGGTTLTVPGIAKTTIKVVGNDFEVVKSTEIKNAFLAISTLGITTIDDVEVDISILNNLATVDDATELDEDKADVLFSSIILNATLSKILIDMTLEEDPFVVIPYLDQNGETVRIVDEDDGIEYISQTELTNILRAVLALNIQDFNSFETLDMTSILGNVSKLLDSAILHATISNQL